MRAIGKGSLASLLAVGLHVTRVILWIAFIGVSIAMVAVPFAGGLLQWLSGMESVDVDVDVGVSAGDYLEIGATFVAFGVMLFVVDRLLEILKTLRFGSPFVMENADRFRAVGFALLIGEASKIGFGFLSMVFDADIDLEMELISWLAVISVFVLSEVFKEGARMKEEQDLTV